MNTLFIIGGIIGLACIVAGLFTVSNNKENETAPEPVPDQSSDVIGDRFRVLTATELIECLGLNPLIEQIQLNIGLSKETWPVDALPFIHAYIEFVQRLPASENHHHAGDGGLVRHTLEVANYALLSAKASSWPPESSTEDKNQKSTVWLYGIFVAAMLHDVGKTRSNYKIMLYPEADSLSGFEWISDTGTMTEAGARYYTVGFHEKAAPHEFHGRIAWMYFLKLVPAHTRTWMVKQDRNLVDVLRMYLTASINSEKESVSFHKLITEADSQSTKNDLKSGSRQRFKTAKRLPMIEVLMQAARAVVLDPQYYDLNVAKSFSGGRIFRKGAYVFCVSQPFFNALYKYVEEVGDGYRLPVDTDRLLDTFMEFGINEPNPYNPEHSIIKIRVLIKKEDGSESHILLSSICFKAETLYFDALDKIPEEYEGELTIPIPGEKKSATNNAVKSVEPKNNASESLVSDPVELKLAPVTENVSIAPANNLHDSPVTNDDPIEPVNTENTLIESEEDSLKSMLSNVIVNDSEIEADDNQLSTGAQENLSGQKTGNGSKNNTLASRVDNTVSDNDLPASDPVAHQVADKTITSTEPDKETVDAEYRVKATTKQDRKKISDMMNSLSGKSDPIAPASKKQPVSPPSQSTETPEETPKSEYLDDSSKQEVQNMIDKQYKKSAPTPVAVKPERLPVAQYSSMPPEAKANKIVQSVKQKSRIDDNKYAAGNQFLNFLADGLANGTLEYNTSSSSVHFVKDGMLLMTPKIFSLYTGVKFDRTREDSPGKLAQKAFEGLRIHKINEKNNSKSAHWNVNNRTDNAGRGFHAYLISEDKLYRFIQSSNRPANNPHLALFDISLSKKEIE